MLSEIPDGAVAPLPQFPVFFLSDSEYQGKIAGKIVEDRIRLLVRDRNALLAGDTVAVPLRGLLHRTRKGIFEGGSGVHTKEVFFQPQDCLILGLEHV